MSTHDKKNPDKHQSVIEDLAIINEQSEEVKGGRLIGVGELQETTISKDLD